MWELLINFLRAYAPAYVLGGINAASLTAIGHTVDALANQIPMLRAAGLEGRYFTPFGSITYWNEIYQVMKNTNRQLGLAGEYGATLEDNALAAYENIITYGGQIEDIATGFQNLISAYGRNINLTQVELEAMGKLNVAFGQTYQQIFSTNLLLGKSVERTYSFLETVYKRSDQYGINIRTTLNALAQNIGLIDRTSFRNGVAALRDMSINAERMRISVQETVAFSERMFDPDQAIETAAQLQLMGGEWAKMGDVFSLMFEGRNNPEELQKRIFEATRGVARLNEMTGEIDIDALGVSQLRAFSQITGQGMEHLMQAARQIAKEDYISKIFSIDADTQQEMDAAIAKVASLATYNKELQDWEITVGQETKLVSMLNEKDFEKLKAVNEQSTDVYKDLIQANRTLQQSIEILTNVILRNLIGRELYDFADEDLKKLVFSVDEKVLNTQGFKFAESMMDNMQRQTYNIASKELGALLTGDVKTFVDQLKENVFAPSLQMTKTLEGVVGDMQNAGFGGSGMVGQLESFIEKLGGLEEQAKKFQEQMEKLNKNIEKFLSLFSMEGWKKQGKESYFWGLGTWMDKQYNKLFNRGESEGEQDLGLNIPKNNMSNFKESKPFLTQMQNYNSLSYNGNINTNVTGSVKLSIEGGSVEKEMILKDVKLEKELLGLVDPMVKKAMEHRLYEFKEDSKRNNGLTNKPLILIG